MKFKPGNVVVNEHNERILIVFSDLLDEDGRECYIYKFLDEPRLRVGYNIETWYVLLAEVHEDNSMTTRELIIDSVRSIVAEVEEKHHITEEELLRRYPEEK